MTYLEQQQRYIDRVDQALHIYLTAEGIPDLLLRSMQYSVFAGGKRLRPSLMLAACELLNGDIDAALPFACAIEMIHCYSLIHDDLPAMDNDSLRRGQPTNHIVFGEGQAILSGDGLLSYAFEILCNAAASQNRPYITRAAASIAKGAGVTGMVAGQTLDLLYEGDPNVDETILREIHHGKTVALIKASVEAGALCANAGADEFLALQTFAEQFGLLFQITDDILDVVGSEGELGKSIGKDEKAGKLTFATLFGVKDAMQAAAQAAEAARAALGPFKDNAWFFRELLAYTLTRKK